MVDGLVVFFFKFFSPRKSTSSEDIFPLSFVGGFGLTESLLFLDTVLSCPDPVAIDTSFVSLAERCVCNPRPRERKRAFHVKLQSGRVSLEDRDGKGRVQFDVEDSVMIYRSR